MKITVVAVGRLKERYLQEGCAEYAKRLSKFCDIETIEVADEQAPADMSQALELKAKKREAERIIKRLHGDELVIALDAKGERLDSEAFASKLRSFFISGHSHIAFVIGGSLGLDEGLLKKADFKLSLSDLTFPHQLARLILMEQLFRAFKINAGETYHK